MAFYLAFKEIWRNRGRYLLFSMVIALITVLVLFIAALAGGLSNANRQFLDKVDAELWIYQENVDLQSSASRLDEADLRKVRRVAGVAAAGPLGFSTAKIVFDDGREAVDVSLIGVEAGSPGDAPVLKGETLPSKRQDIGVLDRQAIGNTGLEIGSTLVVQTIQGTDEAEYKLKLVGLTDERQNFYLPALIVPMRTWDEVRPQPTAPRGGSPLFNVIAVKLQDPKQLKEVAARLEAEVDGIEAVDKETAIQALPGYSAQQNTLNTQQGFTLLIGVLVVGGFFQIQTLQKVAQIGVLKAIGSNNPTVAGTVMTQIILVTISGVGIGTLLTLGMALGLPDSVPVVFNASNILGAVALLLAIGPIAGLVSVRMAVRIDPLTAIGLAS